MALREDLQSVALFGSFDDGEAIVMLDSDDGSMKWIWQVKTESFNRIGQNLYKIAIT